MNTPPLSPPKGRRGLVRLWHATRYSAAGLRAAWRHETASRHEVVAALLLLLPACWLGTSWVETALLIGSLLLVLLVELLNSAVEAAIDRVGTDWNEDARRAKDMGSAAVMVSLLPAAGIWLGALWHRFLAS